MPELAQGVSGATSHKKPGRRFEPRLNQASTIAGRAKESEDTAPARQVLPPSRRRLPYLDYSFTGKVTPVSFDAGRCRRMPSVALWIERFPHSIHLLSSYCEQNTHSNRMYRCAQCVTTHTEQDDHISSREHAWLKIAHLCVLK